MFEYHIDFHGQNKAEHITQGLISAFGVVGFFLGLILQDIRVSMFTFAAGIVVTAVLVVPAWPYLNKNPIKWLPSREKEAKRQEQEESAKGKGKSD